MSQLAALNAMDYPPWFILIFVFLFGIVFGSFLNVCIHRFPKHERLKDQLTGIWGRSHCPRCKTEILARDNIPILGWLTLGGKCRNCKLSISSRYPLIELCNGLLFVLVYMFQLPEGLETLFKEQCVYSGPDDMFLGPQIMKFNFLGAETAVLWMHLRYLFHMVLIECLVVATFIDFDLRIIPDGCTVPGMIFALIASTIVGQLFLVPLWWDVSPSHNMVRDLLPDSMGWIAFNTQGTSNGVHFAREYPHLHGFLASLAGLIVGGGSIWAVRIIGFKALRKEAMGFGDVVLMACIGSFIGWQPVMIVFFLAAICAMCSVMICLLFRRGSEIPYGPYISLGTLLLILFWDRIWPYAKSYFDLGVGLLFVGIIMSGVLFVSLLFMRLIKRLLGIDDDDHADEVWTQADSMLHYAGERIDEQQGQWKRSQWEGSLSGRGLRQDAVWRNGE